MCKRRNSFNIIVPLILAAVLAAAGLSSCAALRGIADVAERISQDLPNSEDTLTSLYEVGRAIEGAMERGETELTFNAAGLEEEDLKNVGKNLSTFWGKPVRYSINSDFKGLDNVIPGEIVDVKNITNTIELSNNYYICDYMQNGTPIPEDRPRAQEIADAMDRIIPELFKGTDMTDYGKALTVHDWLVMNVEYDDYTKEQSEENGSYGAIVLGRTMCTGYAEAFELLLRCYTDVEVRQIVGEATNPVALSGRAEKPAEVSLQGSAWSGHAWNLIKLGGAWFHIDVTYDDPRGDSAERLSHFYFGQNDEVMSQNHLWERDWFPASGAEDFLYFRQSGLFAEDYEGFETLLKAMLTEAPVSSVEIAVRGWEADEESLQFIYRTREGIDEIWWTEQSFRDVRVNLFEFIYF